MDAIGNPASLLLQAPRLKLSSALRETEWRHIESDTETSRSLAFGISVTNHPGNEPSENLGSVTCTYTIVLELFGGVSKIQTFPKSLSLRF